MSKKTKIVLGTGVAVVVIGALTAAIKNKDKDVPRVTTAKVEKVDLVSKVTANGKIQAKRKVDMSALAGHRDPALAPPDQGADPESGARPDDGARAAFP